MKRKLKSENLFTYLKYEALYPTEDGGSAVRTGSVKRRYSEFINLQLRLEDKTQYRSSMKGGNGVNKPIEAT